MKPPFTRGHRCAFIRLLVIASAFTHLSLAQAQPTIVSMVPMDQATGVSPSAAVVFTFSEAMDTDLTEAQFLDINNPFTPLPIVAAWSAGDTVLTCIPSPPFPANRMIIWSVDGENPNGDVLEGTTSGFFTTGTSGGGGSGTNAITTFAIGKLHSYSQTSAGLPTLDPVAPYIFDAVTILSSNRTATNVVLTLPSSSVSDLTQNPFRPESFFLSAYNTNLSTFDLTFPAGDYNFLVKSVSSNQSVKVTLPAALAQPGAPHVTNYPAAQAVNPAQSFVLGWDPFPGGTASDFILVDIGSAYGSPNIGSPGALTGTATSFTIPAGTLEPNINYESNISFYRAVIATNGTSYITSAYRATITHFTLQATGGGAPNPLMLTHPSWTPGDFSFDVVCTNGQTLTVEYADILSSASWKRLVTTNCSGTLIHIVSPQAATNKTLFYRARNGS